MAMSFICQINAGQFFVVVEVKCDKLSLLSLDLFILV